MADPKQTLQSFLDHGTLFEGKISFSGAVRVDGQFRGEASSDGTLVVGESAVVEAQVSVGSLVVHGRIGGDLNAADLIEIGPKARVGGSLRTKRIQIAEGAQVNAKIEMLDSASAETPAGSGAAGGGDPKKDPKK